MGSHGVPSARLRPVPSVFCFLALCSSSLAAAASRFGGGTSAMLEMSGVGGARVDGLRRAGVGAAALRGDARGDAAEEMRQQRAELP